MAALKDPVETTPATPNENAVALVQTLTGALDGILAMAELLSEHPLDDKAAAKVHAIIDNGRRMARLLYDAADTPRMTASGSVEAFNLRDLVDDVDAHWTQRDAKAPSLLLSCSAPADLRIASDATRLRRLLNSLIEGALSHCGQGVVELQLSAHLGVDSLVTLRGRLETSATTALTVPALTLCRTIALQMDGDLRPIENAGGGAQIAFELRVPQADARPDIEIDAPDREGPLPPRTHLLIVDDNATNRIVAAALCEMFGCTAETAEDGVEAVEAARTRPFDLILMDIKMPRMDGLEATRAIRALPDPAGAVPIIALTANADAESAASYIAVGMQAVVDKPIKPDQLLATLQWVLCDPDTSQARRTSAA